METKRPYFVPDDTGNVNVTTTELSRRDKAYRSIVRGFMQIAAGIYELVTDEPAPKPTDVLRGR